jgi:hypothetical protein
MLSGRDERPFAYLLDESNESGASGANGNKLTQVAKHGSPYTRLKNFDNQAGAAV